ncbi:IS3 family transposase [Kitasatospora sp. NPDC058406]|uniref:IS3 family transposase n=1 Tax=Kitasatospora sp. NPDC058406 TaxID=3346483 RepID=UPI00365D8B14
MLARAIRAVSGGISRPDHEPIATAVHPSDPPDLQARTADRHGHNQPKGDNTTRASEDHQQHPEIDPEPRFTRRRERADRAAAEAVPVGSYAHDNSPVLQRPVELAQYGSAEFAGLRRRHRIRRSMGKVGSSYDYAAAESFFASLKRELIHGERWASQQQARPDVFRRVSFYNHRRRHSTLGYLSQVQFEQQTATSRKITLAA